MNSYFVNHPDMIIGEMKQGIEYSMYGDATATACVAPEGYDIVSHLHNAVTRIDGEYHPYTPQQDEIKYGELKKKQFRLMKVWITTRIRCITVTCITVKTA